jgi:hypothetical protein
MADMIGVGRESYRYVSHEQRGTAIYLSALSYANAPALSHLLGRISCNCNNVSSVTML